MLNLHNTFFIDVDDGTKSILIRFADDTKWRSEFSTAACDQVKLASWRRRPAP